MRANLPFIMRPFGIVLPTLPLSAKLCAKAGVAEEPQNALGQKGSSKMIIALVQIPLDEPKRDHEFVIEQSVESTKIFHGVKGLLRKYYLNSDAGGGGIYEFATREDAEAWFNDGWADWMEGRFGVRPTLTVFDNPVVLDNEANEVRVDGVKVSPPWKKPA
ncbi:hypothetical protein [Parasulfitobacter algicola]|uniref:Monooxygenase n=1 Tax=Parasulfitobacter algicola TaxID=2614809 RepID=A0ABX2IVK5_9RHOB|nr:hypothetical protein [Sulfitobacter algicola]NSX56952.1 hypothetical protein [Sulfitobacter algicola]